MHLGVPHEGLLGLITLCYFSAYAMRREHTYLLFTKSVFYKSFLHSDIFFLLFIKVGIGSLLDPIQHMKRRTSSPTKVWDMPRTVTGTDRWSLWTGLGASERQPLTIGLPFGHNPWAELPEFVVACHYYVLFILFHFFRALSPLQDNYPELTFASVHLHDNLLWDIELITYLAMFTQMDPRWPRFWCYHVMLEGYWTP